MQKNLEENDLCLEKEKSNEEAYQMSEFLPSTVFHLIDRPVSRNNKTRTIQRSYSADPTDSIRLQFLDIFTYVKLLSKLTNNLKIDNLSPMMKTVSIAFINFSNSTVADSR